MSESKNAPIDFEIEASMVRQLREARNAALDYGAAHAFHMSMHGTKILGCTWCFPPPPTWREWLNAWLPRVHFGPCNHDDCD